jgi:Ca-activated chloride channel family protein
MRFSHPHLVYLFLMIPALAGIIYMGARWKESALCRFADEKILPRLVIGVSRTRSRIKYGLFLAAVFFLILALIGPRWGFHWEDIKRRGVDLVIVLDTSDSMLSQDVKPNRLERARREIYDLVKMVHGDRLGLVVFSGSAFIQCPLTLDYGAFLMLLDYIDTTVVPQKGTNIGEALRKAVSAFDDLARSSKAIILISDGGNLQGDPLAAANLAKQKGIKIYSIGIGRVDEESPIPLGSGGFKYSDGKMVTTKLQDKVLEQIALATGGAYVRSVTGDLDLEKIYYEEINKKLEKRELQGTRVKRWEERFQWPLTVAVALLAIELLMAERQKHASS